MWQTSPPSSPKPLRFSVNLKPHRFHCKGRKPFWLSNRRPARPSLPLTQPASPRLRQSLSYRFLPKALAGEPAETTLPTCLLHHVSKRLNPPAFRKDWLAAIAPVATPVSDRVSLRLLPMQIWRRRPLELLSFAPKVKYRLQIQFQFQHNLGWL